MDPFGGDFPQDPSGPQDNLWNNTANWSSEFWTAWPEETLGLELVNDVDLTNLTGQGDLDNAAEQPLPPLDHSGSAPALSGYHSDLGGISGAWDPFFERPDPLPFYDVTLEELVATAPHTIVTPQDVERAPHLLRPPSRPSDTLTVGRTLTPSTVQALQAPYTRRTSPQSTTTTKPDSDTTINFEPPVTHRGQGGQIVGRRKRGEATPESPHSVGHVAKRRALPPIKPDFTSDVGDGNHSNFFAFHSAPNGKAKNRRSAFTPQKRKDVAELRKRGACFKCKMWRKACDLGTPCQNCKNDPDKCRDPTVVFSQPCFRLDLTQCGFFRLKSALWRQPLRETMRWISQSQVRLSVQSGRGVQGPYFEVGCCHYSPEAGDIVQRKWGPETHQVLSIPTYCAFDLSALRSQLPEIVENYCAYQLDIFDQAVPPATLDTSAEEFPNIVIATLRTASRQEGKHPLLRAALRLWMATRFLAAPRSLRGKETLGLEPIQDPSAHDKDRIPIPPMLDYQIDTSTIRWMQEVTKDMLKELWKILLRKNKSDWFIVFLIIFVLINTAEIAYEAQLLYVLEHGGADAGYFGRHIERFSRPMLEQWKWSAQHLIFVFRYYVRRCSFEDAPIFSLTQFESAAECAKLDGADREYYKRLIEWRDDIMQLQLQQDGGLSTTEEPPVKQTSWGRQLLFRFSEFVGEWPTRRA